MSDVPIPEDQRRPVTLMSDLDALDGAEVLEGYGDGREGFPCSGNRSRAYWHGWRNGMIDTNRMEPTPETRLLAHNYIAAIRRGTA